jgi:membrane protease YdiL (CAAX protease family)
LAGQIAGLGDRVAEPAAVLLGTLATSLLLGLLALAAVVGGGSSRPLERLGLVRGRLPPRVIALLVLGVLTLSFAADASLRHGGLRDQGTLETFDRTVSGARGASLVASSLVLGIAPAIGEELFFRGLIQRGLEARFGPGIAIPLASLMFAMIHGDPVHALVAFALGLYLGVVARLSGGIRAAILCHAGNNLVAVSVGAFGLGGFSVSWEGVLALLATTLAILWVAWRAARASARQAAPPPGNQG